MERVQTYNEVQTQDIAPADYQDINIWQTSVKKLTTLKTKDLQKADRGLGNRYRYEMDYKGTVLENRIPMSFDIETTGVIVRDDNGCITETKAYMYKWQFGLGDTIIHGRTYGQWIELLNGIASNNRPATIYRILIANLSYEFAFVTKWLINDGWTVKVLARVPRQPITATYCKNGVLLMFADALQIANCTLEGLAKNYNLPSHKKQGDLDYSIPRNSRTPLTTEELEYCSYDCRVLNDFYRWVVLNYVDHGLKFPLTSTGLVRYDTKFYFRQFETTTKTVGKKTYINKSRFARHVLPDMYPPTYDEYTELMSLGYSGGFTHANALYSGEINTDINGGDFTSSYPYTIMFQKFPMSPFLTDNRVKTIKHIEHMHELGFATIAKIRFTNISQKSTHSTISISKCYEYCECNKNASRTQECIKAIVDNGRVIYAEHITLMVTDIDLLQNLEVFYKWNDLEIIWAKTARYDYLPDYVRYACARFYQRKQQLKKAGKDDTSEYKIAKAMVNSVYGMMVQRLSIYDIVYTPDGWGIEIDTVEGLDKHQCADEAYHKALTDSKGVFKQFLSPYWGVWVTSHARGNLFKILSKIGSDAIYCDTDSIYYHNPDKWQPFCDEYNAQVIRQNLEIISRWNSTHDKDHHLDPDCLADLGIFDRLLKSGNYTRFKTLGAKRYVKEWSTPDGMEIEQTIAGLPKQSLKEYCKKHNVDPFTAFTNAMVIPECKNAHCYNDKPHYDTITDLHGNSEMMYELSSVGLYPVDFTLSLTGDYVKLIEYYAKVRARLNYKDLYEELEKNDKP